MGVGSVSDSTSLKDIASWDSFNSLVLLNELESQFEVRFTLDEATSFNSVADIKRILQQRGIKV
ncbi:MAG: acyl carrier protein [Parcubacteria group bacterium]|nr:acyl carrier protein [Parcubacteria group bacterium]